MPEAITLDNGALRRRVSPQGGTALDGFTGDGRPFLRSYRDKDGSFDPRNAACFPLVPIGNRVEGNAFTLRGRRHTFQPNFDEANYIHGDGWLGRWQVEHAAPAQATPSFAHRGAAGSPYARRWPAGSRSR